MAVAPFVVKGTRYPGFVPMIGPDGQFQWGDPLGGSVGANEAPTRNITVQPAALKAAVGPNVVFPTGYAGNDVVEPSILYDSRAPFFAAANGTAGYEYVMCLGGYYQSSIVYEGPNLWVSHDGDTWVYVVFAGGIGTPTPGYGGVLTPVVPAAVQGDGAISDPFLCRGPDGSFYIIFNQALVAVGSGGTGTGGNNHSIKVVTASSLAGPWSAPTTTVATVQTADRPSSPSAFYQAGQWHIYAIDGHDLTVQPPVAHYTAATLASTWTKLANPALALPAAFSARGWWHLNAYRVGNLHLLLIQDNVINSSAGGNLWAVTSKDGGVTWTVPPSPMMTGTVLYRAAAIISDRDGVVGLDLYYGLLAANWEIHRTFATFARRGLAAGRKAPVGGLLAAGPPGAGAVQSQSRLIIAPTFVPAGTTISAVWFGFTGAVASSFFRPVIYWCDDQYWYPGALLLDVGQQDTSGATGDKEVVLGSNLIFDADTLLFVGGVSQGGAPSIRNINNTGGQTYWTPNGYSSYGRNLGAAVNYFRRDATTAAPPAAWTAPNDAAWANAGGVLTSVAPWVGLRCA